MIMDATAAVKMTEELAGVMARTCSPDLKNIDPTVNAGLFLTESPVKN
jgi:hypothetical protein